MRHARHPEQHESRTVNHTQDKHFKRSTSTWARVFNQLISHVAARQHIHAGILSKNTRIFSNAEILLIVNCVPYECQSFSN